jgi:hypothetical protein
MQSLSTAQTEIPHILAKRAPPSANRTSNATSTSTTGDGGIIGSHDYTRGARAVIFGRAFTLAQVEELRQKTQRLEHTRSALDHNVAWVVADPKTDLTSKPPLGAAYAENAVRELKAVLEKRMGEGGIILY